jgi:hypothetical protein
MRQVSPDNKVSSWIKECHPHALLLGFGAAHGTLQSYFRMIPFFRRHKRPS